MKFHRLISTMAVLITVSAGVNADSDRLKSTIPGSAGGAQSEADSHPDVRTANRPFTTPAVPGRSYRNQAPPAYRIEGDYRGHTNAFPRAPGTSFRNYSRPGYHTR